MITLKEQCLQAIENELTVGKRFKSIEWLDTGEYNEMLFLCTKEHLVQIIQDNFDDNLKGAVPNGYATTIVGWEFIEEPNND